MKIYIYLKTHNQTGLKYLGQTTQDPYKYKGSGIRWLNHLRKHGSDVTTEILAVCNSYDQVKQIGKQLSVEFNIVESSEFANIISENGNEYHSPSEPEKVNRQRSVTLSGRSDIKRKWFTDGTRNIRLLESDDIPTGFKPGRKLHYKVSDETKAKMKQAALDRPKVGRTILAKICECCNNEFTVLVDQRNQRYCSRKCSALSRSLPSNPYGFNQHKNSKDK